jgi:hypothetical protein
VLQQIVEMFLTVSQILLQTTVLACEILVYTLYLVTFLSHLVELSAFVLDTFLYLFWVRDIVLITAVSSLCFSVSILEMLSLCLVSFMFFSFWCSSSMKLST